MNRLLKQRRAGVLLHPTSLPGAGYSGTFGADARRFVDLLSESGLQIWQVLPLGPTHTDLCPYQAFSVHAGNTELIDLAGLVEPGLLTEDEAIDGETSPVAKHRAMRRASANFFQRVENNPAAPLAAAYDEFLEQSAYWLQDYVRYRAFRDALNRRPWTDWPEELRHRDPEACAGRAAELSSQIAELCFGQFIFHRQWHELRRYSNERGILLFGDMPIYVHMESADVWAHQTLFDLDENSHPVTVTGVPPDYFSAEGQLWGNPQYDWAQMEASGFEWWLQRFASAAQHFDIARIDHFRAMEAYWEIPADATAATEGKWVAAPGRALLEAVRQKLPELSLVAENLGTISPEVEQLRRDFALPGMLILQFAFDGNPENPYLNHRHEREDIVYTGTHDNNTTLGWFNSLDEETRASVYRYFGSPEEDMPWMLVHQAMASVANTAIVPWQDFLGLNGQHRMNTPGTMVGNWQWRFDWDQVPAELGGRIHALLEECERLPDAAGKGRKRA